MRVGLDVSDFLIGASLATPGLRPAGIESLFTGQAVDHRRAPAAKRQLACFERNGNSGIVGDIFPQCELAVDVISTHGLVGRVLVNQ